MNFVLYHGNCTDGFAAAWVTHKRWPDAQYIPVYYGQSLPDLEFEADSEPIEEVLILDFSYPLDVLEQLVNLADHVTVIDHHAGARDQLEAARRRFSAADFHLVFDIEKSGAMLTWEYCFPNQPAPKLIRYVQDRDLWRWALLDSREVSAALRVVDHDFEEWDRFSRRIEDDDLGGSYGWIKFEGQTILLEQTRQVKRMAKRARMLIIAGFAVPCVNASSYVSELGAYLAETGNVGNPAPFACVWCVDNGGRVLHSLRSTRDGVNVAEIAKQWGGGGHPTAAGFSTSFADSPVVQEL